MSESSSAERALNSLKDLLVSKNEDYRIDGEFSNFEFAAKVAGVSVETVFLVQIGIKMGRLMGARRSKNNESYEDTIVDLNGYTTLYNAYINHYEPEF